MGMGGRRRDDPDGAKIAGRKTFEEIPHPMIAEGIILSIENCKRYIDDAQALVLINRHQTALLCLFLASEEFGKAKLLLSHFLKGENVPANLVDKYFGDHVLKFKEYHEFLHRHSLIPVEVTQEMLLKIQEEKSHSHQTTKERIMYVDWIKGRWHNPLRNADFAMSASVDLLDSLKMRTTSLGLDLKTQVFNFEHDPNYAMVKAAPIIDVPTEVRVRETIGEFLTRNTSLRVEVADNVINVMIHLSAPLLLKKEIREAVERRYPNHIVCIEISKKGFPLRW